MKSHDPPTRRYERTGARFGTTIAPAEDLPDGKRSGTANALHLRQAKLLA